MTTQHAPDGPQDSRDQCLYRNLDRLEAADNRRVQASLPLGQSDFALVDQGVMASAEQDQVGQRRRSPVGPMDHVMSVTPAPRCPTTPNHTPMITNRERHPHGGGHHPGATTDIENLRVGPDDDPGDPGVAGQLPGLGRGDHPGVIQLTGTPGTTFKGVER